VRKRLSQVIRYIIRMAGKLVRHSGKQVFKIYEGHEWLAVFRKLHKAFQALYKGKTVKAKPPLIEFQGRGVFKGRE
jgi:23S rRNA U2552 (ribose-2'-O)-methylase RlmE/FtsJ